MSLCCPPLSPVSEPAPSLTQENLSETRSEVCEPDQVGATNEEAARLRSLHALDLLDTPREREFDDLVQLAAAICGSPIGMISLVDEDRQWFKASLGFDLAETPREVAFCHHAIQQPGLMLVEDATLDPRFSDNPMVTGEAGWRFYAGMPIASPEGQALGTLCVLDRIPRTLTPEQKAALRILAVEVNARIELRSQRRALEEALRSAQIARERAEALEQRFRTFMDCGPFLAYMKDADGRMLYYNGLLARTFNASQEELLNKLDHELWPPHLADAYREHDLEVLTTGELRITNEQTVNRDGTTCSWRSYKFPCIDGGTKTLVGGISIEVTDELHREAELKRYQAELEAANRRLSELASLDALTSLPNRRVFDEELRISFRKARRLNTPLCLLMLDVDHFKSHNDRFGHSHGDSVLRSLSHELKSQVRVSDLVARFGGEEFVVLLPETEERNAVEIGHRLVRHIRELPWPVAPVTISLGVSSLSAATPDPERLVTLADEALYAAKCAGRDRTVSYSDILEQNLQSARLNFRRRGSAMV